MGTIFTDDPILDNCLAKKYSVGKRVPNNEKKRYEIDFTSLVLNGFVGNVNLQFSASRLVRVTAGIYTGLTHPGLFNFALQL